MRQVQEVQNLELSRIQRREKNESRLTGQISGGGQGDTFKCLEHQFGSWTRSGAFGIAFVRLAMMG